MFPEGLTEKAPQGAFPRIKMKRIMGERRRTFRAFSQTWVGKGGGRARGWLAVVRFTDPDHNEKATEAFRAVGDEVAERNR